ncbi:caspase-3-like [Saccostrea echinata]|uniref:caspase-3-like n=1 Tax=Saccostrea echinata TaxID=191078 RepID=UPI002A812F20|nr:caspase-3-like [Saccostrea echinata]
MNETDNERYESKTYKTTPGKNGIICRPVIVDIRKTHFGREPQKRPSASRDIDLLKKTFNKLPWFHPEPYIINDENSVNEHDPLYSTDNLKKELKNIASNEDITKHAEMFVCVVLAFGESGYFYLPNDPINDQIRSNKPPKFSVNDLLWFFKGLFCPNLILKPKVFLIQTCNPFLVKKNKAFFSGEEEEEPSRIQRTPIEADILVYQSIVSGGYTDRMKPETKRGLGEYIDHIGNTDGQSACQFVYALYKEVTALTDKEGEFELNDLILNVNRSLEDFIKKEHYKSDERDKPWKQGPPEVPVCIDQLTKKLVLKTRQSNPGI